MHELNQLLGFLGKSRYREFIREYYARLFRNNEDIVSTPAFARSEVPTKDTDVFVGNTKLGNGSTLVDIIKIWDKFGMSESQKNGIDQRYLEELRNSNYYRRFGMNLTARQLTGRHDDFNFLVLSHVGGTDALEANRSYEKKINSRINSESKSEAIAEKDKFRKELCRHVAAMQAFSSPHYAKQSGEDFRERLEHNVVQAYNEFFMKNSSLIRDSDSLSPEIELIGSRFMDSSDLMVQELEQLPNSMYTDRFFRNIRVEGSDIVSSIDYGSIKELPAQFDLAFLFIQSNDMPYDEKRKLLRSYFENYPEYVAVYNWLVDSKLSDIESTIIDELKTNGFCPEEIHGSVDNLAGDLRKNRTLEGATLDSIDGCKQDVYALIRDTEDAEKVKDYVDEVFDFLSSLEKKDVVPAFKDSNNGKKVFDEEAFEEFCKGMELSEAYRALIVGSAYVSYMRKAPSEENLDFFIQLLNSSYRAWDYHVNNHISPGPAEQEKAEAIKQSLREWKELALKMKKGYIEKHGTRESTHLVDFHLHTGATQDARRKDDYSPNNIINLINQAQECGLEHISVTNHVYAFGRPGDTTSDPGYLEKECSTIDSIKHDLQIQVAKGIEVDYLGRENEDLVREKIGDLQKRCNGFDYILGGVHRVKGEWFLPSADAERVWKNKNHEDFYRQYFSLLWDAVESGLFNYIAHPDIIRRYEHNPHSDNNSFSIEPVPFEKYSDLVEGITRAAVRNNVGMEINVSGLIRHPSGAVYPGKQFLTMYMDECYKQGRRPRLTLGTDSHSIQGLKDAIDDGQLLKGYLHAIDCGYDGRFQPLS